MSGLYNVVFGVNDNADALVTLVDQRQSIDPGRFRDAWVEKDGDGVLIRIHTRNGGGNREDYESENQSMQDHPWYVRDADDDFDCTYADFWFRPALDEIEREGYEALLKIAVEPVDMGARWNAAIEAIGKPR